MKLHLFYFTSVIRGIYASASTYIPGGFLILQHIGTLFAIKYRVKYHVQRQNHNSPDQNVSRIHEKNQPGALCLPSSKG